MATIKLPSLPKGKEFEEYISAFFQSAGYYIERNIIERDVEELLELDLIITDYNQIPPDIKLIELKSGAWRFRDIFKIRGWMDYLSILNGVFIANEQKDNIEFFKQKALKLNIDLLLVSDLSKTKEILSDIIMIDNIDDVDIAVWRYSYWVERNLIKKLNRKKKSVQDKQCYKYMEDYFFEVNSGLFFTENVVDKVDRLYSIFKRHPRISAKCGNELVGNSFFGEYDTMPEAIYKETYYKCKYNDIQVSTFIEHRARLAILKNVIDYKLYKKAKFAHKTESVLKLSGIAPDIDYEIPLLELLPLSFQKGLEVISEHDYFYRYPVFWQWFFWIFGGFILKDYEELEYQTLSQKTGIPISEVPKAFESYQILFPLPDGWFNDLSPNSNIRLMKLFPVPFMGIGAHYRKIIYTEKKDYLDLKITGQHTLKDLIKWNNLMVEVIEE